MLATPRIRVLLFLGALLGALLGRQAASAEEFTLRFQPEPGATLKLSQAIEQNTAIDMAAMGSQEMHSKMRMDSTQTVLAATDSDSHRVEFVFDRMVMSMTQGNVEMMNLDTDAEDGSENPALAAIGGIVGKSYVVEIDKLGGVVSAEGLKDMLADVVANTTDPQAQAVLQQAFSEDSMLQTMQMSMPMFPEEAVGVGDAWSRDLEMDIAALGTISVNATYTVEGLSEFGGEPCVRLGAEMSMEFELNAPMFEQMAAAYGSSADLQMDMDDIDANGWMCIARSDGVTLQSEIETQFTMGISIAAEGQPAMEMAMVLDQVTRQTAER